MLKRLCIPLITFGALAISSPAMAEPNATTVVPAKANMSDGLELHRIRLGQHENFERLVFDVLLSHLMQEELGDFIPATDPGQYHIDVSPDRRNITLTFNGTRNEAANLPKLKSRGLIKKLSWITPKNARANTVSLRITTRAPVKIKAYDMPTPARIVVDLRGT